MKVVIDTNVLVSAILRDRAPEEVVKFVILHPKLVWLASSEIIVRFDSTQVWIVETASTRMGCDNGQGCHAD